MSTSTPVNDVPLLAPELRPNVDHLVTEDDTPVDNIFSEKQQRLLTESLHNSWATQVSDRSFVAMANVGLFYAVHKPPYMPDMLLSLDVSLPTDIAPKSSRSYFTWEYGKPPDVVVEVVSNKEGGELTAKINGYAQIGVKFYVVYDPFRLLTDIPFRVFQLKATSYVAMEEPVWLTGVDIGVRLWQGRYEDLDETWLRWVDATGELVLVGAERTAQEQHHTEQERQRAEQERQRADRLADQLRRMGVPPEV
jgi:Uma2 family endonuclease